MLKETKLLKVIRENCMDCSGDDTKEVKHCEMTQCSLHPYRSGKYPVKIAVRASGGTCKARKVKSKRITTKK